MANIPVEFEISDDVKTSLDNAVTKGNGDYDAIVNIALENHLSVLEENEAILKSRMKEAENGKWIDGDAMLRWVESLGTENELPEPVAK